MVYLEGRCSCEVIIYYTLILGFIITDVIILLVEKLLDIDNGTIKWYTILSASIWAMAIVYVFIKKRIEKND